MCDSSVEPRDALGVGMPSQAVPQKVVSMGSLLSAGSSMGHSDLVQGDKRRPSGEVGRLGARVYAALRVRIEGRLFHLLRLETHRVAHRW